jgi:hypothetical protein
MKVDLLIFSKNRPAQLDLLLRSINENASGINVVSVLYTTTSHELAAGYEKVIELHPTAKFYQEKSFMIDVKDWLTSSKQRSVMMLVDDIVFRDRVDFSVMDESLHANPGILCYSPRLGLNLDYCYTLDKKQPVPNGNVVSGMFVWQWMTGESDWSYVFSVDGHLFRRNELESWVSHLAFNNPNTLEAEMQKIAWSFDIPKLAVCHVTSRLFNIPANRVQDVFENRSGDVSIVEINEKFKAGSRLSLGSLKAMNSACHEERILTWES